MESTTRVTTRSLNHCLTFHIIAYYPQLSIHASRLFTMITIILSSTNWPPAVQCCQWLVVAVMNLIYTAPDTILDKRSRRMSEKVDETPPSSRSIKRGAMAIIWLRLKFYPHNQRHPANCNFSWKTRWRMNERTNDLQFGWKIWNGIVWRKLKTILVLYLEILPFANGTKLLWFVVGGA